jgi:hypothetical protein
MGTMSEGEGAMSARSEPMPPAVSDRTITTLAILKVNHDGQRTFLGNFLPFVYHCLAMSAATVVSLPDLQASLEESFTLHLPRAVLNKLLVSASEEGKVRLENHVYVVQRETLAGCNLTTTRNSVHRGYQQLLDRAAEFAQEQFSVAWPPERVRALFSAYIDGFSSSVLASALSGKPPPEIARGSSEDEFIVHRFVSHIHERDQQLFQLLESVVKGRMLADALYFEASGRHSLDDQLEKVEVYLDGPLLLRLLGYGGPELKAPYRELLEMLKRQGAILRCFRHSTTEAQEILDAAAGHVSGGHSPGPVYGDVVAHLVRSGKSQADIELMSHRFERDLLREGIQTVDPPERNPAAQPDEERLDALLQREVGYSSARAKLRDIDSLTAIERLRGGRGFRDLSACKAVFVTHNYELFKSSTTYFESRTQGSRLVPLCVFHTFFIVMVWLKEPAAQPELPRERIIADAYAALNPDDRLWETYNREIGRLQASGALDEDDVRYLRFADEARISLMDLTRGNPNVFTEGTVAEVLERSRESVRAELRAELEAERSAREQTARVLQHSQEHIREISARAARWTATALFAVIGLALLMGAILGPVGPIKHSPFPAPVQLAFAVCAIACGLWSVLASRSLIGLRASLERWLTMRIVAMLERTLQLPDLRLSDSPLDA